MRFNSHKNIFSTFVSAQREKNRTNCNWRNGLSRRTWHFHFNNFFCFSFVCCNHIHRAELYTEGNLLCFYALVKWCRLNTSNTQKHFQFLQFNDKVKCIVSAIKNRKRTKKKFYFMDISVFSISLHLVIIIIYHPQTCLAHHNKGLNWPKSKYRA